MPLKGGSVKNDERYNGKKFPVSAEVFSGYR